MGFNNEGADRMAERLARVRSVSSGPAPSSGERRQEQGHALERAADDYRTGIERLYGFADYFTINISSPNTPGLRDLQETHALADLLASVARDETSWPPRLALGALAAKLAPDSTRLRCAASRVCCSTPAWTASSPRTRGVTARAGSARHVDEAGGLSGRPLEPLARRAVATLADALAGRLPIIGVGGVHDVASAKAMVDAGATLVQIYTAFLYRGPKLVRDVARRARCKHNERAAVTARW